ncbi:MAG: T9SS type A sorting domain-containing protein [Bacteroidia bacterium]|nr:T9SS type A sorting domain-containing protein [Bacteroidia bacterium]
MHKIIYLKIKVTSILLLALIYSSSSAQPALLDITFDGDGIVTTPIGSAFEGAYSILTQPDGKIILAGYSNSSTGANFNYDFAIVRYNTDGSLDTSFSQDGKSTVDFGSISDFGYSAALQADGKIIVIGKIFINVNTNIGFAVTRVNADGTLDLSFSGDGKYTFDFNNGDDQPGKVALQSDGKIVIGGSALNLSSLNDEMAMIRLDSSGTLDGSFGVGGKVLTSIGSGRDRALDMVVLPNDEILLCGRSDNGTDLDFAIAKYDRNGNLSSNFGSGGKISTDISGEDDYGNSIAVQTDGKIIMAGYTGDVLAGTKFAMIRYDSLGQIDVGFGLNGKVVTDFVSHDQNYGICIQADHKILLAGRVYNGSDNDFGIARYDEFGNLDNSFDLDGKLVVPISNDHDEAYAITVQQDGKILVAGRAEMNTTDDFALIRILGSGTTETSESMAGYSVKAFPIPMTNQIIVNYSLAESHVEYLFITDMHGKVLMSSRTRDLLSIGEFQNVIDVSMFSEGTYLLHLRTNEKVFVKKLIKM